MSDTVTCDECQHTEANGFNWWRLERHNPLLEFRQETSPKHFCSGHCLRAWAGKNTQ